MHKFNHDNLVFNYSSLNIYWVSKIRRPLPDDGDDHLFVVSFNFAARFNVTRVRYVIVPNLTLLSFSHFKRSRWSPVCCDLLLSI